VKLKEGTRWSQYMIRFTLDRKKMLDHDIRMDQVVRKIRNAYGDNFHLQYSSEFEENCILRLRARSEKTKDGKDDYRPGEDFFLHRELLRLLGNEVMLSGVDGIRKTFIKQMKKSNEFCIETEGTNLQDLLALPYIDKSKTYSNDIAEISEVLGVDAAFISIIKEINQILQFYDIYVNYRNHALLSSLMCNAEKIMGLTRHGMNRNVDNGPLVRASFEETSEILNAAARFAEKDNLTGVSESIMIGAIPPIGTGSFDLIMDTGKLNDGNHVVFPKMDENVPHKRDYLDKTQIFEKTRTSLQSLLGDLRQIEFSKGPQILSDHVFEWMPPSPSHEIFSN
jgi:DNA-directed RNA polymerase II subunit RPB1